MSYTKTVTADMTEHDYEFWASSIGLSLDEQLLIIEHGSKIARRNLAGNRHAFSEVLLKLATDSDTLVRQAVACNRKISLDTQKVIASDTDRDVLYELSFSKTIAAETLSVLLDNPCITNREMLQLISCSNVTSELLVKIFEKAVENQEPAVPIFYQLSGNNKLPFNILEKLWNGVGIGERFFHQVRGVALRVRPQDIPLEWIVDEMMNSEEAENKVFAWAAFERQPRTKEDCEKALRLITGDEEITLPDAGIDYLKKFVLTMLINTRPDLDNSEEQE